MADPFYTNAPASSKRNRNYSDYNSFKQPRLSLADGNMSSIPQPASALRKPSYRPSLAPNQQQGSLLPSSSHRQSIAIAPGRGGGGVGSGNGVHYGNSRAEAANPRNSIRRSMAPMSSSSGNMRNSRQSSFGLNKFSSSTVPSSVPTRDPRPLRDKQYQATISQEIHEYLAANKFEIEMKQPLTPKTLKTPTQKEFVLMFQWLYKRLDPGYRFTKSIEHEVYFLLKTIKYPYLESINKSQISAVGGQNWPVFMGMLYWLVQLNQTLEIHENKQYEGVEETEDMILDQIFTRYVCKSYGAFLANEDDYSEYKAEMQHEFENHTASVYHEIQSLEEDNEQHRKQLQDLSKDADHLTSLQKKGEALESDLVKFKAYIDSMEQRKVKWTSVLEKITDELTASEKELSTLEQEKQSLQSQISSQGLTPADIDKMNSEREKLGKALESIASRLDEVSSTENDKELTAQKALESLEQHLQQYSSSLYRIGISSTASAEDFEINLDNPLNDANLGKRPDALLNGKDLKHTIRPALQTHRQEISMRVHKAQDEAIRLQELLDRLSETISEKKDQVETLEAKLNTDKITYDELYETMNSDASASNAEIERLERELHSMKVTSQQGLLQLNQRSQSVAIEHDQLKHSIQSSLDRLNADVEKTISAIINFKLHIQSTLENYENFILDECEREDKQLNDDLTI
jgi:kinetochore protein NDC80